MSTPPKSLVRLRVLGVKILAQALHSELSLEEAMFAEITRKSAVTLPDFDRAWVYELCSGVLRFKGRLDYIIDTYSLKKKPSGPLRRYLYTGVYQLLAQDTPAPLIVSETVQAVREQEGEMPSKFVNAILRKVSDSREQWQNWQLTPQSPREEQMAWCSLPEWLFKKLVKQRGFEFTRDFALASLERPQTWYRNLETGKSEILTEGVQGHESQDLFKKGFVQDISNQKLIEQVNAFLSATFTQKDKKILDLCSAPGGKSLALAADGWPVVATDRDPNRLQKVIENKNRLNFTDAQIEVRDFKKVYESTEKWPILWLDVPCFSVGIIRRHPEIKWNRTEKDLPQLIQAQKEIVEWAKAHLEPDGIMIYSTCSLLNEENRTEMAGFKMLEHFEFVPQIEPFGDGIIASLFRAI